MALSRFNDARLQRVAALTAALGLLAACAVAPGKPEEVVKARAQERWDVLVKGEVGKAYQFLSPGSKAVLDEEGYRSSVRRGFWKSARVQQAECSAADACDVTVEIEYQYRGALVKSPLKETWVLQERNWWYVLK